MQELGFHGKKGNRTGHQFIPLLSREKRTKNNIDLLCYSLGIHNLKSPLFSLTVSIYFLAFPPHPLTHSPTVGRRGTGQPIIFFFFYQDKKELKIILLFSIIH